MDHISLKIAPEDDSNALSKLKPITPAHSTRYSKGGSISLTNKRIPPGFFSRQFDPEPEYFSPGWSEHVQPEGQRYFYHSKGHIVTEANIYDEEQFRCISCSMEAVDKLAHTQNIKISNSVEIFLQLDEDDQYTCGYYLVEHASHTVFWLHETTSEDIGVPDSASFSQLRLASNEHYWTHVEYFPTHMSGVKTSCIRDLIGILTHARADHLTSLVGTFPYNAAQCKEYVDLLRDHMSSPSDLLTDPYVICVVARLMSQVARHRFLNYYGETNARLSRDQHIVDIYPKKTPRLFKLVSKILLFDLPHRFVTELETLWVDNLVYAEPWKHFMIRCLADWKESGVWTLALIIIHALFYAISNGSRNIAIASMTLSIVGFIASLILANYHRIPLNFETAEAADFLERNFHPTYGFTLLSLVYSIPKALLFWSAGTLLLQMGFAVFQITDVYMAGALISLTVVAVGAFAAVLRRNASVKYDTEEDKQETMSTWRRFFHPSSRSKGDLEGNDEGLSAS
ncbi:hypothetical protein DFH11DRAFT_1727441 [Phellopilus nigrolimitatus]|nr:hypothetical protein DFH11DRAFT_1727441 [Phellopilus nigrolimitatus]